MKKYYDTENIIQAAESSPAFDFAERTPCMYAYRGCKEKFTGETDKRNHERECIKRKYKCEGKIFCGWNCDWTGYFEEIPLHFGEKHRERTYMRHQFQINTELHLEGDSYDLQLIKMRKKLFW